MKRIYKYISITSLLLSALFSISILLEIHGMNLNFILYPIDWFFGWPLYIVVLSSLVISVIGWLQHSQNRRYVIYSILSIVITFGTVCYTLLLFAQTMSDFD